MRGETTIDIRPCLLLSSSSSRKTNIITSHESEVDSSFFSTFFTYFYFFFFFHVRTKATRREMKRRMDSSFDTWRVNGTTIIPRESNWGEGGCFAGQVRESLYRKDARPDAGLVRRVAEGS